MKGSENTYSTGRGENESKICPDVFYRSSVSFCFRERQGEKQLSLCLSKAIFVSLKSILCAVIKRRAICELFAILMPRIRERGEQAAVQFYLLQQTSVGVLLSYFSFILPLCKILIAPFHQLAVCMTNRPPHIRAGLPTYMFTQKESTQSRS